ncbi:MAG TPA: hypothetical protein VGG99_22390 [Acetobacteraceae bacterium]|jgi:hypothetical protein
MITQALRFAHQVDAWLDRTFGPPYRILLAVGLGAELIRQCRELIDAGGQAWHVLPILLDLALLLHTADALYERLEHRQTRAAGRRGRGG